MAIKVHKRNYIGAVPGVKIRQFNMGNPLKDFDYVLDLTSEEEMQVRDNAIESVRTTVNRYLNRKLGKDGYYIKIRIYPFHILRENKQAQGAGADRVTKGMAHPFGKPIGRAARVSPGQVILSLLVDSANLDLGKLALTRMKSKLPCKISIKVHKDIKSIGTRPKKTKEEKVEEKAEETTTEAAAAAPAAGKEDKAAAAGGKAPAGGKAAPAAKKDEKKK